MRKLNIKYVKNWIRKNTEYELVSEKYVSNCSNLHIRDNEGYSYYISYSNLSRGKKPSKFIKFNPYTINNIRNWIKLNGYNLELLSNEYNSNGSTNPEDKLKFKCDKGHFFYKTWHSFSQYPSCNVCNPSQTRKSHKTFLREVTELCGGEYTVLSEYIKATVKVTMRHNKCGTVWDILPSTFLYGVGCPNFKCNRLRGEDNPRWNPNLTDEERIANRDTVDNIKWRNQVFEKYNYECQICFEDTGKSVAHHMDSYDWAKDRRLDVSNGVCLCERHHKEFHGIYGYGNNTEEQYRQFKNNHLKKA